MHSTSRSYGFTVIELVLVVVLLLGAAGLLTWQRNNLAEGYRDEQRKTAINAMYYGLEESFYKEKGYYPLTIADNTLATVDNALLKDPDGVMINTAGSSYRYQPERCDQDKCQGYTLSAEMEREATFTKRNRDNAPQS